MDHIYDVIILGAGPAGLSAGLYAGRSRLDTLIIEKGQAGGQIINTDEIENYPGQIVEGETGVSLVRRMYEQTEQFGAEHVRDTITNAELSGDIKVLTGEKDTYQAKNIIIATGAYARPIGCKGEQEYKGRGISYCATCDANFFTDLEVYVAGGGDAQCRWQDHAFRDGDGAPLPASEFRRGSQAAGRGNPPQTLRTAEADGQ